MISPVNPFNPFALYDREHLGEPIGREGDVSAAQSLLLAPYRLCIVSGELGIGKSTFLRHSLFKALQDTGSSVVMLTASSSDTVDSIIDSLFVYLDYKDDDTKQEVGDVSKSSNVAINQALTVVNEIPNNRNSSPFELYNRVRKYEEKTGSRVMLIYDQLENLLNSKDISNKFLVLQSLINLSAVSHVASSVILAVRDKFLHEIFKMVTSYPWITSKIIHLHGLDKDNVKRYISKSTSNANISFSEDLIDNVIIKISGFDNFISPILMNSVCYSLACLAIKNNAHAEINHFSGIGEFPGVIGKAIFDSLHPLPVELISDLIYMLRVISNMSQYYDNPTIDDIVKSCSGLPADYIEDGVAILEAKCLIQEDSKKRYRLAHDSMHVGVRHIDKVRYSGELHDEMAVFLQRWTNEDRLLASHEFLQCRKLILEETTPLNYLALIAMSFFSTGIQPRSLELQELRDSLSKRASDLLLAIVRQHVQRAGRLTALKIEEHFLLFMLDTELSIRFSLDGLLLDSSSIPSWRFQSILEIVNPKNLLSVISEVQLFLRLPIRIQDAIIKFYNNLNDVILPSGLLLALWGGVEQAVKPSLISLLSKSGDDNVLEILRTAILRRDGFVCLSSLGIVPRMFPAEMAIKILLDYVDTGSTCLIRQSIYALSHFSDQVIWNKIACLSREHPSALVREAAIEALGEKKLKEHMDKLIEALKDEADFVRESACYALAKMLEPNEFAPLLLPLLGDISPLVRDAVFHTVPPNFHSEETIYTRLHLLRHAPESTQLLVLKTFTESKNNDISPELDQLFSTTSDDVVVQCLKLFGDGKAKEFIPRLVTLLKSDNEEIVCESLIALQETGDERIVQYVTPLANHYSADVRERVVYLLGKLGNAETVEGLMALLFDVNDNIRVRTIYALGKHQVQSAYNHINMLSDTPEELKQAKQYYFSRVECIIHP